MLVLESHCNVFDVFDVFVLIVFICEITLFESQNAAFEPNTAALHVHGTDSLESQVPVFDPNAAVLEFQ